MSSGKQNHVTGLVVPDISEDYSTFKTSVITVPTTKRHTPEDLHLQLFLKPVVSLSNLLLNILFGVNHSGCEADNSASSNI